MARVRLYDVDRARGLAIVLVVLGHLVAGTPPLENEWYVTMEKFIYRFHMPFFMYLSGFVMLYTYSGIANVSQYTNYVWSKFIRLAPGFLFFAMVILVGKLVYCEALQYRLYHN